MKLSPKNDMIKNMTLISHVLYDIDWEDVWQSHFAQLLETMTADTSIVKAFSKGMIDKIQKETIEAKGGNPAQVNALLNDVH